MSALQTGEVDPGLGAASPPQPQLRSPFLQLTDAPVEEREGAAEPRSPARPGLGGPLPRARGASGGGWGWGSASPLALTLAGRPGLQGTATEELRARSSVPGAAGLGSGGPRHRRRGPETLRGPGCPGGSGVGVVGGGG